MYKSFILFLPLSKRNIKIDVYAPKYNKKKIYDSIYMLDGQNAFKDKYATFSRSLRATKAIKKIKKDIIAIAIYSNIDVDRTDEYSPFIIDNISKWKNNNIEACNSFCQDLINTIIPFIENTYNINKNPENRYIYGSSLAAITAIYLGFKYNSFNYIGAFSIASFLYKNSFINFINNNLNQNKKVFLYVGLKEESDDICNSKMYIDSSNELYNILNTNNIVSTLMTDEAGIHNESYWEIYFYEYLKFIYKEK